MSYYGFSGYGISLADIQNLVVTMKTNGMNIIRVSGTPTWQAQGAHALKWEYVDWLLANTGFDIIVDPNHLYGTGSSADFEAHLADARAALLAVANRYKNNPRIFIEIVNEYYSDTDNAHYPQDTYTYSVVQGLINDVRAICGNPIVYDKQPPGVPYRPLTGASPIYTGDHGYFGVGQYDQVTMFNNLGKAGLPIICTEIGADWNEGGTFTAASIANLTWFRDQCAAARYGVCIWLRELSGEEKNADLAAYKKLGFVLQTPIIITHTCPTGYHWDDAVQACVQDVVPPARSFGARTIGPFGLPLAVVHLLRRAREKIIRPEVHKKLHPLV